MATYSELFTKSADVGLRNRVAVAIVVAANGIFREVVPSAQRVKWARRAMSDTNAEAERIFRLVLAENNTLTIAQIDAATDAAIQANVDAVVDGLVAAEA